VDWQQIAALLVVVLAALSAPPPADPPDPACEERRLRSGLRMWASRRRERELHPFPQRTLNLLRNPVSFFIEKKPGGWDMEEQHTAVITSEQCMRH